MGSIRWGCLGWPRARPPPARPPAASGEGQCWGARAKLPLLLRSPMLLWVTPRGLEERCLTDPMMEMTGVLLGSGLTAMVVVQRTPCLINQTKWRRELRE